MGLVACALFNVTWQLNDPPDGIVFGAQASARGLIPTRVRELWTEKRPRFAAIWAVSS